MTQDQTHAGRGVARSAFFAAAMLLWLPLAASSQTGLLLSPAQPSQPDPLPHLAELARATSPFDMALNRAPEAATAADSATTQNEALPSAPSATMQPAQSASGPLAPRDWTTIPPGYVGAPLGTQGKFVLAMRESFSLSSFGSLFVAAGYSHLVNGQPNYGTDRGAFGERLGATLIRETTQNVLSDGLLASAFHEDPRYYILGPQHGFFARVLYAATRPLITRADDGHNTFNASLVLGYGAAAGLTPLYYPRVNRNATDVIETWSSSLGGAALGNAFSEFAPQLFTALHLRKAQ